MTDPAPDARGLPRARCPECSRIVAVNIPSGGDGTVDVFRNHRAPGGERCPGGRRVVRNDDYVGLGDKS